MRALVAWRGGLFLTEGKIVVLSVSSLSLTRACVSVCIRTHTHTAQMGCSDVSPGVGMRHLEGPKNPDRLKRSIHVDRIGVHTTFVYIYAVLRVLMIWANCFFVLTCHFFLEK